MTQTQNPIDEFLVAVEGAQMQACEAFAEAAELDATVPNWRFGVRGDEAVRTELGRWYADQGHFEELHRTSIPNGELVEFTLCWEEQGVPHACHQAHVLGVSDGRIVSDRAWCGGRWPASLLAQMGEASRAGAEGNHRS